MLGSELCPQRGDWVSRHRGLGSTEDTARLSQDRGQEDTGVDCNQSTGCDMELPDTHTHR